MLPDYPKVKALVAEGFGRRIVDLQNRKLGVFSKFKATILHEGAKCHTYRSDGSFHEMEMKHIEASAQLQHDIKTLETLEVKELGKLADILAHGMAREKHNLFLATMDQACEESGNITSSKQPLVEQIFDGYEKVWLDFEPSGEVSKDFMLYSPNPQMQARLDAASLEIQTDPALKKRFDKLMDRKRQEFRDREATRNLVE
jgi:hypothetical protein